MAGSGNLVKMGAAWVYFGTVAGNIGEQIDLGYTKGGISFSLETQTHEITVDQEGITPIAETIMGRRVTVQCPMAESDYERLQLLIPESTYASDSTGYLLEIASGVGASMMDYADELVIVSKADPEDWIKIYKAAPVANIQASFTADGERIWPIQFKGYVPEVGHAHVGQIIGIHEGS
jgi:hypothetical protein